jgi:serine phosphatase RsbU (regulator of sigma subunit)/pSer/pThr/pTyr-binding forkhead associated (FHA) protein
MASLQILKGANEGTLIPLDGDRFILGRNPDCAIVIPVTSVSREHAQILRDKGRFFIVDGDSRGNPSRNGTFVNNQAVTARTQLKNNDKIRICDFLAAFLEVPSNRAAEDGEEEPEPDATTSTVEAMLSHSSQLLLETQPAEKLRLLVEISNNLSKTLELGPLLPKIADSLFGLFRQADRCFLIQAEEGSNRLLPRVVKTRRPHDEANARFSRSIVRRCLDTGQAFLSDDAQRDDRVQLSQSVVDFRIRSVMCVPLCNADGKAFGVIQLDTQDRSKKFTQEDLKLLWGVANHAAIAMENARLLETAVAQAKLKRDLELAHQVQMSFLPRQFPTVPGYDFFALYQPASEVGGDYYGFTPLPDGRLAAALGDVAGKGVPAALFMSKLSSDARFSLLTEPDPAAAVCKLNDLIAEFATQADRFVTLALVVIDPKTHRLTLVSAGHPSPLLVRPGVPGLHEVITKQVTGLPLGILEGFPYESCEMTLKPGESLLLFSDGVVDPVDQQNRSFGPQGIQNALYAPGPTTPRALVERVFQTVQRHAAGRPPFDDITLVAIGRTA